MLAQSLRMICKRQQTKPLRKQKQADNLTAHKAQKVTLAKLVPLDLREKQDPKVLKARGGHRVKRVNLVRKVTKVTKASRAHRVNRGLKAIRATKAILAHPVRTVLTAKMAQVLLFLPFQNPRRVVAQMLSLSQMVKPWLSRTVKRGQTAKPQ